MLPAGEPSHTDEVKRSFSVGWTWNLVTTSKSTGPMHDERLQTLDGGHVWRCAELPRLVRGAILNRSRRPRTFGFL